MIAFILFSKYVQINSVTHGLSTGYFYKTLMNLANSSWSMLGELFQVKENDFQKIS